MKNIGKPCAGKPHARFDEGGQARACSLLYPSSARAPLDYLKSEAAKGKRSDFEHYLSRVPDVPAQPGDEEA